MFGRKSSPVVSESKPISMTFGQAIDELAKGAKISRVEWNNPDEYGILKGDRLVIHTKGKDHAWLVSDGDIINKDWIVIPE